MVFAEPDSPVYLLGGFSRMGGAAETSFYMIG